MRNITGVGEGKGAVLSMHDGFEGQGAWYGFLAGADRLAIDVHPYQAFGGDFSLDPTGPCLNWGLTMDTRYATPFRSVFLCLMISRVFLFFAQSIVVRHQHGRRIQQRLQRLRIILDRPD